MSLFRLLIVSLVISSVCRATDSSTMASLHAEHPPATLLDPSDAFWASAPVLSFNHDQYGKPLDGNDTEVRSRWTSKDLYILFICHYESLYLKPNPVAEKETFALWNWDVAEAFIGDDFEHIDHYKEFELSPQAEWVDLDIVAPPNKPDSWLWNSGFKVEARTDTSRHVWYGVMSIPFDSISKKAPVDSLRLRINLFRAQGAPPNRKLLAWRPTNSKTFHVPEAFGTLRLVGRASEKSSE